MPLEAMLGEFPDGDAFRKMQPSKNNVIIVDLPAATDHDEHRDGINPVRDPDRRRMKNLLHFLKALGESAVVVRQIVSSHRPYFAPSPSPWHEEQIKL